MALLLLLSDSTAHCIEPSVSVRTRLLPVGVAGPLLLLRLAVPPPRVGAVTVPPGPGSSRAASAPSVGAAKSDGDDM
jgi:hypothetical protein